VSQYQKGKTDLDFTGARDSEWQWHHLGDMQVCISLQTDNHASTSLLKFFTGLMPFLPPNQQCQSTEGTMIQLHIICIIHTLDFAVRQSGFLRRQFVNECCQFLLAISQYFTRVFLKTLLIEGTLKTWGHRVGRGLVGLWLNPVLTVSSM